MSKITIPYFDIEYTNQDQEYIELIINCLNDNYLEIMQFFNLSKLEKTVHIKFWNSITEYHTFFNEKLKIKNRSVPAWETVRATINSQEWRIDLLSLEEEKSQGHENDTISNLMKVILHEFVHICHMAYINYSETMLWFAEALATALTNQYGDTFQITCSQEDIFNGTAKYSNYYAMGKYLISNYDKEYILELAKDKELLTKTTANIYNETTRLSKRT